MIPIQTKVASGVLGTIIYIPLISACYALAGHAYARLAYLPPNEVSRALAIWAAAETAILTISLTFSENSVIKFFIKTIIMIVSTKVGIQILQKKGLIGSKLAMFIIALQIASIFKTFINLVRTLSSLEFT